MLTSLLDAGRGWGGWMVAWRGPWRIGGRIALAGGVDRGALLARIARELRRIGCGVVEGEGGMRVTSGSEGRMSAFALVDGGEVWLAEDGAGLFLAYAFSTLRMLYFCLAASVVAGAASWWSFGDAWLTGFGLVAPVGWVYGANYVTGLVRVPATLRRLCAV